MSANHRPFLLLGSAMDSFRCNLADLSELTFFYEQNLFNKGDFLNILSIFASGMLVYGSILIDLSIYQPSANQIHVLDSGTINSSQTGISFRLP